MTEQQYGQARLMTLVEEALRLADAEGHIDAAIALDKARLCLQIAPASAAVRERSPQGD